MPATRTEPVYGVKPVLFWKSAAPVLVDKGWYSKREPLGYMPMIYGVNRFGSKTILASALADRDVTWRDPTEDEVYATAEEAMAAWESAAPVELDQRIVMRARITDQAMNTIIENGLHRNPEQAEQIEDNPFEKEDEVEF